MKVRIAESDAELERISGVLLQLRTAFDSESLVAQIKEQRQHGYQVEFYLREGFNIASHHFSITDLAGG